MVIGILAAISIVAYNGISQKAENAKTAAAAEVYIKAIRMYEQDKGGLPGVDGVCLGVNYPWDYNGGATGDNQCRYSSTSYYKIKGSLNETLGGYISPLPYPSMQRVGNEISWARGIYYAHTGIGGEYYIGVVFSGNDMCPGILGLVANSESRANGMICRYTLGPRPL